MDKIKYLGDIVNEVLYVNQNLFTINILGYSISIPETIVTMWIVMFVIILLAFFMTRKLTYVPNKKQSALELGIIALDKFVTNVLGERGRKYIPYFGTLILFLLFANVLSLFNFIPSPKFFSDVLGLKFMESWPTISLRPPTKDINLTATLAIMSIIFVLYSGVRYRGVKGFIKSFAHPMPIMIPFNIMDYFIRPMTLALRLFGNILAGIIMMEIIELFCAFVVPAALSVYFDVFDAALQAYIFVFLTMIYASEHMVQEH